MTDQDPLGDEAVEKAMDLLRLGWMVISPKRLKRFCVNCDISIDKAVMVETVKRHCSGWECVTVHCTNKKVIRGLWTCQGHQF